MGVMPRACPMIPLALLLTPRDPPLLLTACNGPRPWEACILPPPLPTRLLRFRLLLLTELSRRCERPLASRREARIGQGVPQGGQCGRAES